MPEAITTMINTFTCVLLDGFWTDVLKLNKHNFDREHLKHLQLILSEQIYLKCPHPMLVFLKSDLKSLFFFTFCLLAVYTILFML